MTVNVIKGKYPHVGWVDIEGKGVLTEVAIMKNADNGIMFIRLNALDAIDKQRLFKVISNRNAHLYELWDLMSNITLGNGANALEYFHQYVKILTPTGQVLNPREGEIGAPQGIQIIPEHQVEAQRQQAAAQSQNDFIQAMTTAFQNMAQQGAVTAAAPAAAPVTEAAEPVTKTTRTTRRKTTTKKPAAKAAE